ncbi:ribosomal protein S18-alanine N-acetyltransferase [Desulfocurvibacter africanus]|nr:ribosomal protein S18-alanine N-acetyltransferase [Desulfocurvibacter africanus]
MINSLTVEDGSMPRHEGQAKTAPAKTRVALAEAMDLRRLGPEHSGLVADLERLCFPTPWNAEQLRQGMEQGSIRVYGVLAAEKLLGYLSYYAVGDEAEVVNFAVGSVWRRQGKGRALLGHVLQKWREEGIRVGFLEVRASNEAAIHLYTSCGFRQMGVRRGYYPETGEDALLLKLTLADLPGPVERTERRYP